MSSRGGFDPYAILAALERERLAYVVVGALARVIHGAPELTRGVDLVPSLRPENLRRLDAALAALGVHESVSERVALEQVFAVATEYGEVKIVAEPVGTRRGYEDLRRHATREPIGAGIRPPVASTGDLVRMLAALDRQEDAGRLRVMRQVAELERGLSRSLER